jgi:hypothetical protein
MSSKSYNTDKVIATVKLSSDSSEPVEYMSNNFELYDLNENEMVLEILGPSKTMISIKFSKR